MALEIGGVDVIPVIGAAVPLLETVGKLIAEAATAPKERHDAIVAALQAAQAALKDAAAEAHAALEDGRAQLEAELNKAEHAADHITVPILEKP